MNKKISVSLGSQSIDNAIRELKTYQKKISDNTNKIVDILLENGEDFAKSSVGHVDTGETVNSIHTEKIKDGGNLYAGGASIWIEFGTGVTRNSMAHPKASELGMSAWGTYGKGNGVNPDGWFYYDDRDGKVHKTKGIAANMFMYRTAQHLREIVSKIAKEVFGK